LEQAAPESLGDGVRRSLRLSLRQILWTASFTVDGEMPICSTISFMVLP
jgi:hypothetical protein